MSRTYTLVLASAARRSLEIELPVPVAFAVWEFCDGVLRQEPFRVGKPLVGDLAGYHSARRGAYRVVYRVIEADAVVHVVRIDHRSDVYRRL